jgi:hypothetical protein
VVVVVTPMTRFSEKEGAFFAAEVVLALEYLHSYGIVYRDLKVPPANSQQHRVATWEVVRRKKRKKERPYR